jgi:hypothetical protein
MHNSQYFESEEQPDGQELSDLYYCRTVKLQT